MFIPAILSTLSGSDTTLRLHPAGTDKVGDEQTIKAGAAWCVLHYRGRSVGVDFLKGAKSFGTEPSNWRPLQQCGIIA
jgi:hypothetical protein